MCGIIGYIGNDEAPAILLDGLKRMEYRGYDSAGIAVCHAGSLSVVKRQGKIAALERALATQPLIGSVGIGHTRWATHGIPSDANAHPHLDCAGAISVVHNGIIENAGELRAALTREGHRFVSETDTEVVSHLIEAAFAASADLEQAVFAALARIRGTYGIVVLSSHAPDTLIAARLGSPLVIGIGSEGEYFIASDVTAMLRKTRTVIYLEDHEVAVLHRTKYRVMTMEQTEVHRPTERVEWDAATIEKRGFDHFLLKEICEQPEALANAIRGRIDVKAGDAHLGGIQDVADRLAHVRRLIIVACGTAYYAGLVGEYMIEEYAGVPVEVELASEFRYRKPILNEETAVVFLSQSGETADTLAALKEVKRKRALAIGLVNVVGSSIARETDAGVYIHAGPEVSVASTKAFTNMLGVLALLAVFLGRQRALSFVMGSEIVRELARIPEKMRSILERRDEMRAIASAYTSIEHALFVGRKYNFAIAYEGALKLKEVSYVHAEAYGSGEMKHGPIALIDEQFPTIAIVPRDSVYEKNASNLAEIRARKGPVIAIATEGDTEIASLADHVFMIPKTLEMLTPLLSVIPLQLFAYYSAVLRGRDVDQPRNLAKSVTVE